MSLKISNQQGENLKEKVKKFIKINQDLNAQNIILRELSIGSQKDEILDLKTIKQKYTKIPLNSQNSQIPQISQNSQNSQNLKNGNQINHNHNINLNPKEIKTMPTIPERKQYSSTSKPRKKSTQAKGDNFKNLKKPELNRRNDNQQALQPNSENKYQDSYQTNKIFSNSKKDIKRKAGVSADNSRPKFNTNKEKEDNFDDELNSNEIEMADVNSSPKNPKKLTFQLQFQKRNEDVIINNKFLDEIFQRKIKKIDMILLMDSYVSRMKQIYEKKILKLNHQIKVILNEKSNIATKLSENLVHPSSNEILFLDCLKKAKQYYQFLKRPDKDGNLHTTKSQCFRNKKNKNQLGEINFKTLDLFLSNEKLIKSLVEFMFKKEVSSQFFERSTNCHTPNSNARCRWSRSSFIHYKNTASNKMNQTLHPGEYSRSSHFFLS